MTATDSSKWKIVTQILKKARNMSASFTILKPMRVDSEDKN